MAINLYKGDRLRTKKESDKLNIDPYIPSGNLIRAVQLAQILQRPLLVKGEPGCGKSRLAEAIAAELFGSSFRDYYFQWNIKSSSKALDGLYVINNLQRLSDANFKSGVRTDLDIVLPKNKLGYYEQKGKYIELGVLGKAFQVSHDPKLRAAPVVLIDEIDKADIDFPNDLLLELDQMEFKIPDAKDDKKNDVMIKANPDFRPLIIITSNDEKPLPPAFLRRCLFYYIDFSEVDLPAIINAKYPNLTGAKSVPAAVKAFEKWRDKIKLNGTGIKNISTGELLDWIKLVDHYKQLEAAAPDFIEDNKPILYQALLKDAESLQVFAKSKTTQSA